MELLRKVGPECEVVGKVTNFACVEVSHEVSHVEPAPEELDDNAKVERLLEKEVNKQNAQSIQLR